MIDSLRRSEDSLAKSKAGLSKDALWRCLEIFARQIEENEPYLTELDRAIGDADHGVNMRRGLRAVTARMQEKSPDDLGGRFRLVSTTLTSSIGGAAGPLYGAFFLECSRLTLNKSQLTLIELAAVIEAGLHGVVRLGKAAVGDKTMVDALNAAVVSLRSACGRRSSLPEVLQACAKAADDAARGTRTMVARKGRASYLGKRSIGHQDPGATSAFLFFDSLAQAVSPISNQTY
jgi:dihydroxyacetone kinase-like protein